jgi:hypothetical protein
MRTIVLLDLIGGRGAAAIRACKWSRTQRAFGPELQRFLSTALQNRVAAFKR